MAKSDEIVFGIHAVNELMKRAPERFIELFLLKGRDDERLKPMINLSRKYGISTQLVNRKVLDDKSEGEQHQGVLARITQGKTYTEHDLDDILLQAEKNNEAPFLLVLDGVTDPHNLGACLRKCRCCRSAGYCCSKR